ncbi:hypothetical protein [Paraburkholderia diazotrophica]|uniref:Uncharacterized protein n=1 Tax=Paraburkholderia diazotrophica TaxID=667676 RepID=A0A1H6UE42_9BURK|nr:hypothetical protein [Paraburkholderia diazotrophica]SEI90599.1 hypothetical protein SAMN05192539_10058 [Paraburkholderia diazotrophica]
MKDAFERRALLLHLGDALHAIDAALAVGATRHTVRDLLDAHANLATHAWLAAVSPETKAADFAKQASASFAAWPAQLLEEQVDYAQLALAVRDNLFADNASGWRTYVDAMKREVEWFGDALPERAEPAAQTFESADADVPSADAADAADVERAKAQDEPQRESVESNGRLYPSWPWKPGV